MAESSIKNKLQTYLTPSMMTGDGADSEKAKERAEKLNVILKQLYNALITVTTPSAASKTHYSNATDDRSNRVYDVHDTGINPWHNISFKFKAQSMDAGMYYPLLKLKPGSIVKDDIQFFGTDAEDIPSKFLSNYGTFLFTYDSMEDETDITFYCDKSTGEDELIFEVYLNFLFIGEED